MNDFKHEIQNLVKANEEAYTAQCIHIIEQTLRELAATPAASTTQRGEIQIHVPIAYETQLERDRNAAFKNIAATQFLGLTVKSHSGVLDRIFKTEYFEVILT